MRAKTIAATLFCASLLAGLSACEAPPMPASFRVMTYRLIGDDTVIDPATGETVVTSHWQYENGETTTTTRRYPRGTEWRRRDEPKERTELLPD